MYYIEFNKLSVKNFMSIGNTPIVWDINEKKKTLIQGKNYSGKTTLFQALTFALFGRSYAKIKKSNLVNDINGKSCSVELTFKIQDNQYKIIRDIKPDSLKIFKNDELIPIPTRVDDYQAILETSILKMNFNTYTQIIMLGTAGYTPFLQLKAQERRNFVEAFLDIEVFTGLNKQIKTDAQLLKNEVFEAETVLRTVEQNIAILQNSIKISEKGNQEKIQSLIDEYTQLYESYKKEKASLDEFMKNAKPQDVSSDIALLNREVDEVKSQISKSEYKASAIRESISFLDKNPTCPKCTQPVTPEHKSKHLLEYNSELEKIATDIFAGRKKLEELQIKQTQLAKIKDEGLLYNNTITSLNSKLNWYKDRLKEKFTQKQKLESEENTKDIDDLKSQLKSQLQKNEEYETKHKTLLTKQKYFDIMLTALKDSGAKAEIIKNYVPIICAHVNKYLEKLNLYIKFELDEEFNETLKSRHRNEFQFESFSMGERMRINIALLWAWREVAKQRTGIETNLLCFDEVLEILDYEGFEELLSLVDLDDKLNCTIISHKIGIESLFDKVMTVKKVKGFTHVE